MMTTKRHMQGRKGRAAMELGKQRFVKQAHLEKEEREQTKFEAAWAAAKLVHKTRMVVNAFRIWRAVQGAAKAAAKAKAAVQQEAVKRGEAEAALLAARKAGLDSETSRELVPRLRGVWAVKNFRSG